MSALTVYDCSSVRARLLCVCVKKWARSPSLPLSSWSLSTVPVLDMLVSLTDGGCPLYSCTSIANPQSPPGWVHQLGILGQLPGSDWNHGNLVRKLSRAVFSPPCFYSCLYRGGGGRGAGIGRNKVGNSFIWLVHDGVWMPAWPLPVCDSWHMAALYLHQPPSLRLRPLPSWLCTREAS